MKQFFLGIVAGFAVSIFACGLGVIFNLASAPPKSLCRCSHCVCDDCKCEAGKPCNCDGCTVSPCCNGGKK